MTSRSLKKRNLLALTWEELKLMFSSLKHQSDWGEVVVSIKTCQLTLNNMFDLLQYDKEQCVSSPSCKCWRIATFPSDYNLSAGHQRGFKVKCCVTTSQTSDGCFISIVRNHIRGSDHGGLTWSLYSKWTGTDSGPVHQNSFIHTVDSFILLIIL